MNLVQAVTTCFSKYASFEGRASRSEYWWFTLFNVIVSSVLSLLQGGLGHEIGMADLYALAVLLPGLGVSVRRLHDIGRSGWWLLVILVPLVGWIVLLVWHCTRGEGGPNRFGPDPLTAGSGGSTFAQS
ncbi:DUF805 domain-containing protein [Paracoccus sp. (in: a-proteobacteria)]|uniref:DUF805 domain-containing protein n=1 Tax=Paracoccus sp. TaxID=267 RepID=UPI00321FF898